MGAAAGVMQPVFARSISRRSKLRSSAARNRKSPAPADRPLQARLRSSSSCSDSRRAAASSRSAAPGRSAVMDAGAGVGRTRPRLASSSSRSGLRRCRASGGSSASRRSSRSSPRVDSASSRSSICRSPAPSGTRGRTSEKHVELEVWGVAVPIPVFRRERGGGRCRPAAEGEGTSTRAAWAQRRPPLHEGRVRLAALPAPASQIRTDSPLRPQGRFPGRNPGQLRLPGVDVRQKLLRFAAGGGRFSPARRPRAAAAREASSSLRRAELSRPFFDPRPVRLDLPRPVVELSLSLPQPSPAASIAESRFLQLPVPRPMVRLRRLQQRLLLPDLAVAE